MGELAKRVVSSIVLAAILLGALWLGGAWFGALLCAAAAIALYEYTGLIRRGWSSVVARVSWLAFGIAYIGLAAYGLWDARAQSPFAAILLFFVVWAIDVGAFAFGRTIGGPRIAPSISPSKTWAGYLGAVIGAVVTVFALVSWQLDLSPLGWGAMFIGYGIVACALIAAIAQAGDFFESWLKRRAGVKDSGALIPGHGGLLDRVDGLLPLAALFPLIAQVAFPT